jgi:hypothetical protein
MLNNDEPRQAPIHRASVASLINDEPPAPPPPPPPRQPTVPSAPPAPAQDERPPDEPGSQSRKRPRTEDSPPPPTPAQRTGSVSAASSPVQRTKTVAQSPVQRNNSVIMLHEPLLGLEPSIVNIQPAEELSRFISDFIFLHLDEVETANLEVAPLHCEAVVDGRLRPSWGGLLM